jgi:hypothetical protein
VQQGQIVAARMTSPCPVGSCNFVLIRHQFAIGKRVRTFFSLYFHLGWATETAATEEAVGWLKDSRARRWREDLDRGEVALLGVNVAAGEVIGTLGEAGPPGEREDQIHFAIFSPTEITRELDPDHFEVIDGTAGGRFCTDRSILSRIDRSVGGRPPDGLLSRRELRNFFRLHPRRAELRRVAVRYRSEWTPGSWIADLSRAPDFARLPPARRRRLVAQQIQPTLWWTEEVARHAHLPSDGVVTAYHPIEFLLWFSRMLRKNAKIATEGIGGADDWKGKLPPEHLKVDAETSRATIDEEDFHSGEQSRKLTLEDLANGYPD